MYLNLILGILVIAAIVWLLVLYNRKDESPREMLADEISRRRAAQETARKAAAVLERLRGERLKLVERDLAEMRQSLPQEGLGEDSLTWNRNGEALALTVQARPLVGRDVDNGLTDADNAGWQNDAGLPGGQKRANAPHQYLIRWDIKDIDIDFLAGLEQPHSVPGVYGLTWPDGHVTYEEEHAEFMRVVSGLIADRLA